MDSETRNSSASNIPLQACGEDRRIFNLNGALAEYQYRFSRTEKMPQLEQKPANAQTSLYHRVSTTPEGDLKMEVVLPVAGQAFVFESVVKVLAAGAHTRSAPPGAVQARPVGLSSSSIANLAKTSTKALVSAGEDSGEGRKNDADNAEDEEVTTIRDRRVSAQSNFSCTSVRTVVDAPNGVAATNKRTSARKGKTSFSKMVLEQEEAISEENDDGNNNFEDDDEQDEEQCQERGTRQKGVSGGNNDEDAKLHFADKKNVVKNFVKAFRAYLTTWGDEEEIMEVMGVADEDEFARLRARFAQIEKKRKYNNKLLRDLIVHKVYGSAFCHFLQKHAHTWLENSMVQDKASHSAVLQFYVQASSDRGHLNSLRILKTKRRAVN